MCSEKCIQSMLSKMEVAPDKIDESSRSTFRRNVGDVNFNFEHVFF